jgi:hypothetical protein
MRPKLSRFIACIAFAAGALACHSARAVVVLQKGAQAPLFGYLVRQDATKVVIRLPVHGALREAQIDRNQIEELIVTVDPERLTKLDPSQPKLYREYAEELAEKQRDPEARDAAIRLFAIAALEGDAKLRKSALLGLIALARSPAEERRFRAAAYLHDPEHDRSILQESAAATSQPGAPLASASPALLEAIQLARQGKSVGVRNLVDSEPLRKELQGPVTAHITREALWTAAHARQLPDDNLAVLLRVELALDPALAHFAAAPQEAAVVSWSQGENGLAPMPSLALDRITEFDPRESVFREGKWVRP